MKIFIPVTDMLVFNSKYNKELDNIFKNPKIYTQTYADVYVKAHAHTHTHQIIKDRA